MTGKHIIRGISCKKCESSLGWMYEFAFEDDQKFKEGKFLLEKASVSWSDGIEESETEENDLKRD